MSEFIKQTIEDRVRRKTKKLSEVFHFKLGFKPKNVKDTSLQLKTRITFNVSGSSYETYGSTLSRFPKTLLGDPERRLKHYQPTNETYFLNRSRIAFEAILFYYQSNGCLVRPPFLSMECFEMECIFYELDEKAISRMKEREGYDSKKRIYNYPLRIHSKNKIAYMWMFFESPESSLAAKIYAFVSIHMIAFSIIMDCFETSPWLAKSLKHLTFDEWEIVKISLNSFFAMEYMLRLISSPNTFRFVYSLGNTIDFLAIYPAFLIYILSGGVIQNLLFIRVLRTFRILRLVRLSKSFESLSVVLHILSQCSRDLLTLVFCLLITFVVFGAAIYYAEQGHEETQISSIPEAMWLAMQTIVSIGYGDVVPISILGKLTTAITAAVGALTMTVPLLSLGGRYFSIYTRTFDATLSAELLSTPGPGVKRVKREK